MKKMESNEHKYFSRILIHKFRDFYTNVKDVETKSSERSLIYS